MAHSYNYKMGVAGFDEEFSWRTGAPLHGLNLSRTEGGWLLVVKTVSQSKGRMVAFFGGRSPDECVALMWEACDERGGIQWKQDRYAK